MFTIGSHNEKEKKESNFIDLQNYALPESKKKVIAKTYEALPDTGFDIYNYEKLISFGVYIFVFLSFLSLSFFAPLFERFHLGL